MREKWGKEEEQYLIDNYATKNIKDIMKHLDRSYNSVKRKAQEMGLEIDIYKSGLFYSSGEVMSILGLPKTSLSYFTKKGYIKCSYHKSFNKKYKKYSVENIVKFMTEYPTKWAGREFDTYSIRMLLLDYQGNLSLDVIKQIVNKPESFWGTHTRFKRDYVPTISEYMDAI